MDSPPNGGHRSVNNLSMVFRPSVRQSGAVVAAGAEVEETGGQAEVAGVVEADSQLIQHGEKTYTR